MGGPHYSDSIVNFVSQVIDGKAPKDADQKMKDDPGQGNEQGGHDQPIEQGGHDQPIEQGGHAESGGVTNDPPTDVVTLTEENFKSEVLDSEEMWLVEFYAPWCGYCQQLVPHYKAAATKLLGKVKVGMIDSVKYQNFADKFKIDGYPTIKIFPKGPKNGLKTKTQDYEGENNQIFEYAIAILEGKPLPVSAPEPEPEPEDDGPSDVVKLTQESFGTEVLGSKDLWLVEFYAPWCGHCKHLAPHYKKAATELLGKAKLGMVDATVHEKLADGF